jgi:cellobiose-specific phosphotransferase system component IIC
MDSRLLGKIRSMLLTIMLATFVLGLIGSMTLMTPSTAQAQEEDGKKDDVAKKPEVRELGFGEKIGHFLTSVGPLFGLMFVLISIFMLALFIIQIIDLRLSEAVPPAFVEEFTELVNKRKFKEA